MNVLQEDDVPELIFDSNAQTTYKRGRFFGKGGFAKCYEITELSNNQVYAGKVVCKKTIASNIQRDKMFHEIQIHKTLKHENVVGFFGFFEDKTNIYIILELCRKRSMMELHRRRCRLTEPETRYYMKQILNGVKYLHDNRVIHRDLKLGNVFLNDDMIVKIGDFGLATVVESEGEQKKTMCGTPNYIAPEILNKSGHSFEVDIWSLGCIMYTLLVGKPPFETRTLKETYAKIKRCEYKFPRQLGKQATRMIIDMIQTVPEARPKVEALLKHDFFAGYTPSFLPPSALTMTPRFDQVPKQVSNDDPNPSSTPRKPLIQFNYDSAGPYKDPKNLTKVVKFNARANLELLRDQLKNLLVTKPGRQDVHVLDEMTDPQAQPLFWVSKWVDYSDKYGFGYQLCDKGVGVMFNDTTKLIMLSNRNDVHYIDRESRESYMTFNHYPQYLDKKMRLLFYFDRYMQDNLMAGGPEHPVAADVVSRIPHLYQWCRSPSSIVMHLTNGTLQINFHQHTKIILCPLMCAVTYVDANKMFNTFRFATIQKYGCPMDLYVSLRYAYDKIVVLLEKSSQVIL